MKEIWSFLVNLFENEFAAAGFIGNMCADSGLNPGNGFGFSTQEIDRETFVKDGKGYGICNWTSKTSKRGLYNNALRKGKPMSDLELQLDFLKGDLTCIEYKDMIRLLKRTQNVEEATKIVCCVYEANNNNRHDWVSVESRTILAKAYFNRFSTGVFQEMYAEKYADITAAARDKVKVRQSPSFLSKTVGTIEKRDSYKIFASTKSGRWIRILYRNDTGWIRNKGCEIYSGLGGDEDNGNVNCG